MGNATLDFVKAHAGWDECIFVKGRQIPKGRELEICMGLLRKPGIGGIETGILYPAENGGDLRLKMVDDTAKGYIKMCGGMTQTIGKVIGETDFAKEFGLAVSEGQNRVDLETDAGIIPILILMKNGRVVEVKTDMSAYAADCYQRGVNILDLNGIRVVSAGITETDREYLVIDAKEMKKSFAHLSLWDRSPENLEALESVFRAFFDRRHMVFDHLYGILFQEEPKAGPGVVRAVFRFAPWTIGQNDPEFGCGTGSVALAIALHATGRLNLENGPAKIRINVGGPAIPAENRVETRMTLEGDASALKTVWFGHNRIELVARGQLYI